MEGGSLRRKNHSLGSVIAALLGNVLITALKFAAFLFTNSSAMLAETLHSLADIANQLLLLVGIQRGKRKADENFPFGYGKERYFWNLISTISTTALAVVAIRYGITTLLEPNRFEIEPILWIVLLVAAAVEGTTLWIAWKNIQKDKERFSLKAYVENLTDPTGLAVLLEDSAALLGIFIAFLGIGISAATSDPLWDSIASILIGLLLMAVALFLGNMNRVLLIGRAHEDTEQDIEQIFKTHPAVERFHDLRTAIFGSDQIVVMAEIEFKEETILERLGGAHNIKLNTQTVEILNRVSHDLLTELEYAIHQRCPEVTKIYIEPEYPPLRLVDQQEHAQAQEQG